MTHLDWNMALLDEPDDGLVRLAFADWLEEHAEGDRAAWVRACAAGAGPPLVAWTRADAAARSRAADADYAFERGWPAVWRLVAGVDRLPDRGLVRFVPRYPAAVDRLAAAASFAAARAAGWVGPVDVSLCSRGPDRLPDLVGPLGNVSLAVASYGLFSPGPPAWLGVRPALHTLTLDVANVSLELVDHFAACPRLRVLTLGRGAAQWNPVGADVLAAAVRAARAVPGLRRLALVRWWADVGSWPVNAVLALADHPTLRRLVLHRCHDFSAAVLDEFRAAAPHVSVEQVEWLP